jgi:hypothetical protein
MRLGSIALSLLLSTLTPAFAQLGISFGSPGVRIGINLSSYPTLQAIPGYPVYYAPGLRSNYFFYDGLYWVFEGDMWYASDWYNGPWSPVDPMDVPVYLLRVPVRYYRQAPVYFRSWRADDAPRWDQHWGSSWGQRHRGWDQWDRRSAPAPAPLPTYQRQYSGNRYPQGSQQALINAQNYRYQPQQAVAQQHFQQRQSQAQSAPQQQIPQQQQPQQQQRQQQQGQRQQQQLQQQQDQRQQQQAQRPQQQQQQQDWRQQQQAQRPQQQQQQQEQRQQQQQQRQQQQQPPQQQQQQQQQQTRTRQEQAPPQQQAAPQQRNPAERAPRQAPAAPGEKESTKAQER